MLTLVNGPSSIHILKPSMASSDLLERLIGPITEDPLNPLDPLGLLSVKHRLDAAVAGGGISIQNELEARTVLAGRLMWAHTRHPVYLQEAIEQSEMVVDRLPRDSPNLHNHLRHLSHAYLTRFWESQLRYDIDKAVRCSRLAEQHAKAAGLDERDLEAYRSILDTAADVLTAFARFLARQDTVDMKGVTTALDEAIACTNKIRTSAPLGSPIYLQSLASLARRLYNRALITGSAENREQAVKLLSELQVATPRGSRHHGEANIQLGRLAALRYDSSGQLRDLDDAIAWLSAGVDYASPDDRPTALFLLTDLYVVRYAKLHDVADLWKARHFSSFILFVSPDLDPMRGTYLLLHLKIARELAHTTTTDGDLGNLLRYAYIHLGRLAPRYSLPPFAVPNNRGGSSRKPPNYSQRRELQRLFCDILGRRYMVSGKLDHLDQALAAIDELGFGHSNLAHQGPDNPPLFNTTVISTWSSQVGQLAQAPPSSSREVGEGAAYEKLRSICNEKDFVGCLSTNLTEDFTTEFRLYVEAAVESTSPVTPLAKTRSPWWPISGLVETGARSPVDRPRAWIASPLVAASIASAIVAVLIFCLARPKRMSKVRGNVRTAIAADDESVKLQ